MSVVKWIVEGSAIEPSVLGSSTPVRWLSAQKLSPTPKLSIAPRYCTYIVQSGDTWSRVASRYYPGVLNATTTLQSINPGIVILVPGLHIKVPCIKGQGTVYGTVGEMGQFTTELDLASDDLLQRTGRSPSGNPGIAKFVMNAWDYSGCTYMIQTGDTLFGLGLLYNVSVGDIASLNGISDPSSIVAGQVLAMPTDACTTAIDLGESLCRESGAFFSSIDKRCFTCPDGTQPGTDAFKNPVGSSTCVTKKILTTTTASTTSDSTGLLIVGALIAAGIAIAAFVGGK